MTKKLFLLSCIALAFIAGGCAKDAPVAPEINAESSADLSLSKRRVSHVSATYDFSQGQIVDRGREWVDAQGVYHVRKQIYENSPISGGFVGVDEHNVFNADIDQATGNGRSWGKTRSNVTWMERNISGIWLGEYENRIVAGQMIGKSSWVGRGGFAGLEAKGKQETVGATLVLNVDFTISKKEKDDDD
jgi:hypothetical protein